MTFLGSLFHRQPAPLIGLDVSSSSVKLVELGREAGGRLVLERCAIEPLAPGWVADGQIDQFDAVADAVRRVVRRSGARARHAALALPPLAVITRKIVLPGGLSEQEFEFQVESEASQYIPFPLDEVSLDFCVMGASAQAPGDVEVLIAASRKEKVQDREGLAEAAGLKAVILDIESHAARSAAARLIARLPGQGRDAVIALFEIGAFTTSMQVLQDQDVLYEREQAFGGAQLSQLIARQYGFSAEEAEAKKRSGDLPDDYAVHVLSPFVASLAQEIGRVLQFFFTSTPHHRVDQVLLAGGSAGLPGLAEAVIQHTAFAAFLVNPFEGMQIGTGVREKAMRREAPSYLTSCGLAMRRFLP